MSAKMFFQNKISFVFLVLLFKVLFLYSSIGYTASISDEELERGLKAQYQSFLKTSVLWHNDIGPAVQFVYHLLNQDHEDYLDRKLAMLIGRGAGVGGISQQPANEAERRVLFTGISKAKAKGASKANFLTKNLDTLTLEGQHQTCVSIVYDRLAGLSGHQPGSTYHDFTRNDPAFGLFNSTVEGFYSFFQEEALKLMASEREDHKRQLLQKGFSLLSTSSEQEEFTSLIEEVTRVPVDCNVEYLSYFHPSNGLGHGSFGIKFFGKEVERSELLENLLNLIGENCLKYKDEELISILTALICVPVEERQEFIDQVLQIQEKYVHKKKFPLIVRLFLKTPKTERPQFLEQVLQVREIISHFNDFLDKIGKLNDEKQEQIFVDRFIHSMTH